MNVLCYLKDRRNVFFATDFVQLTTTNINKIQLTGSAQQLCYLRYICDFLWKITVLDQNGPYGALKDRQAGRGYQKEDALAR